MWRRIERPVRGAGRSSKNSHRLARRTVGAQARKGFIASKRSIPTPLESALAQQRGRVFPERLGEGIAQIRAADAEVGEHTSIELRERGRLSAVPARTRDPDQPTGQIGQPE